ncbi:MAG: hypothetical protein H0U44_08490 [Flavisolibacter sp.]|jgi:hypothetical protein|nr:hypothetical protein [Flavisolibacter sp.]
MKENQIRNNGKETLVLAMALLAFLIPLALIIFIGLTGTGGVFSYPVDDTYIHMKIAGNLAAYGSWGINPGEFNSASSSILYTILLSVFFLFFSDPLYVPLAINITGGIVLICIIWKWLKEEQISYPYQLIIFLLVIFFTPLPVLVLSGMEHVLQCIFALLFLKTFAAYSSSPERPLKLNLLLFALLLVATRYEGLFLIVPAFLYLLYKRQWTKGFLLLAVAFITIILFGIISILKGSYFFPNSVLVKSEALQFTPGGFIRSAGNIIIEKFTFSKAGITLLATQRLLLILPLSLLFFRKQLNLYPTYKMMLCLLTAAVFFQLALADTGKFYRYEAYLVLPSVLVIGLVISKAYKSFLFSPSLLHRALTFILIVLLFFPLFLRSSAAFTKAGGAMINIYEQQMQMAKFLQAYYPNAGVAANDIGAISYFRNGRIVDLWGLATLEIAKSKKGNYWTADFLDSISVSKNATVAVLFESWIGSSIPSNWTKVATWQIMNNVVSGDDIVSFYAIDPSTAGVLKQNLENFQNKLPATVRVAYY